MDEVIKNLQELGLEEKEARLYFASLSLGESSMSDLAEKSGLKRSTAYLTFESLEKKGLMGSFKMKSGLRFVPSQPETLKRKEEEKLDNIKKILPQLKSLTDKVEDRPRVRYYEGKEGYITAANESLEEESEKIRHFGGLNEIYKVIGPEYDTKHYIPNRVSKNIEFKALYFESEFPKELRERKDKDQKELREVKTLPDKYLSQVSKLIYGNRVAIFSTKKELVTVIIESKAISDAERKNFDMIWGILDQK